MSEEVERIAGIEDPFQLLRLATERLATAQRDVAELSRLRRRVIQDLHSQGMSYSQIADAAGLSRGRVHQIFLTFAPYCFSTSSPWYFDGHFTRSFSAVNADPS